MKPSNGKIARLPKDLRDRINTMIRDNIPYATIIETLGKSVRHINERNFTNWKSHGYLDWLKEQKELARMREAADLAIAATKSNQDLHVHEAGIHLAAKQMYEALADLGPQSIRDALAGDRDNYTRIANALARLGEGSLRYARYRAQVADSKAIIEKELQAAQQRGGLTPESVAKMQRALNLM
jgi:hypothetical protein